MSSNYRKISLNTNVCKVNINDKIVPKKFKLDRQIETNIIDIDDKFTICSNDNKYYLFNNNIVKEFTINDLENSINIQLTFNKILSNLYIVQNNVIIDQSNIDLNINSYMLNVSRKEKMKLEVYYKLSNIKESIDLIAENYNDFY